MLKKISLVLLIVLYIGAGINHFWHPDGYYSIIPDYIPNHYLVNILAGMAELILGVLLIFPSTRSHAPQRGIQSAGLGPMHPPFCIM